MNRLCLFLMLGLATINQSAAMDEGLKETSPIQKTQLLYRIAANEKKIAPLKEKILAPSKKETCDKKTNYIGTFIPQSLKNRYLGKERDHSYTGKFSIDNAHQLTLEGFVEIFQILKENPNIQSFAVSNINKIMNGFSFNEQNTAKIAELIKANTTLTSISFYLNDIKDVEVAMICNALKDNKKVIYLDLSYNDFGAQGMVAVGQLLQANNTLIWLNLENISMKDDGLIALAQSLKTNTKLNCLSLSFFYGITCVGLKNFADVIKNHKTLGVLTLSIEYKEFAQQQGMEQIAEIIEGNNQYRLDITGLRLSKNKGMALISHSLKSNTRIDMLYLNYNDIGDDEATLLGEALTVNKGISTLYLKHNKIGSTGVASIGKAISANNVVQILDLTDNKIGDEGAIALANIFKQNKNLNLCLTLFYNGITKVGETALQEVSKENPNFICNANKC